MAYIPYSIGLMMSFQILLKIIKNKKRRKLHNDKHLAIIIKKKNAK
jgi:hypothetical protein